MAEMGFPRAEPEMACAWGFALDDEATSDGDD